MPNHFQSMTQDCFTLVDLEKGWGGGGGGGGRW